MLDTKKLGDAQYKIAELNREISSLKDQISLYKTGLPEDSDLVFVADLSGRGIAYKESQLILQIKRVADGLVTLNTARQEEGEK